MGGSHDRSDDDDGRVAEFYRAHGMQPGWLRVWRDGVDITDTVSSEEWPWPFNESAPHPPRPKRSRRR
jgi:hypothetical protein